jgi:hypothetical protein
MLCCESFIDERGAGNLHATFCGARRLRCNLLVPGAEGETPSVYSAEPHLIFFAK